MTESGAGGTTTYKYDTVSQLSEIDQSATGASMYFAFTHGHLTSVTLPGHINEAIGYDSAGRETSIVATRTNADNSTTTLDSYTGTYTTASGADSEMLQSETNNLTGAVTHFGYDGNNRLTAANATNSAPSYTYTYDSAGNRTGYSANGTTSPTFGYNAPNELVTSGGVPMAPLIRPATRRPPDRGYRGLQRQEPVKRLCPARGEPRSTSSMPGPTGQRDRCWLPGSVQRLVSPR